MVVAIESTRPAVCSPQQKQFLNRLCSSGASNVHWPTYSMQWQLPSSFTSYDRIAYMWQAVASHHPILRTSITLKDRSFEIEVRNRASPIRIKSINEELAQKTCLDTADLAVCVEDTTVSLRLRIQQALVDRPSLARIRHDLQLFYDGLACEPLNPFRNYISHIQHRDEQRALAFWRETMSGVVTSLTYGIPTRLRGKQRSYHHAVDAELLGDIILFCEAFNVSTSQLFHAVWALVQYRHNAATDGNVIFAVTGRDKSVPESDTYVGFIEQQYPLKLQIKGQTTMLDWILQVSKADQEAASHAFVGYESISREILPLEVQVQLVLRDGMDIVEEGTKESQFPLVVNFDTKYGSITATYNSETDNDDDLTFVIGHLVTAIRDVVRDPRTTTEQISIISKDEEALLAIYSEPFTRPVPGLVHRLVERQADSNPESEAICYEGQSSFTYAELNNLANQVARQLKTQRGDKVPVCMDRSPNFIIALLAILKTGAAYVVLDPESPQDRCDFIVSDVNASLVIADSSSIDKFANSISIEKLVSNASQLEDKNLRVRQHPSEIVYVIYTSGSTGRPKGVLLEHQAATTGLDAFPTIPNLRQLLFHNPVFSAAQRSIWSTLKQGGCLCLARKEKLSADVSDMIKRMAVNVIDVTPSTASLIDPKSVPTLKRLTVAGELINPALLPIWMDRVELLNAYGLSENTQINWRHLILPNQNPQNIGRPVDSTRSYVLIPGTTQQAAVLEPGELCLGGDQLARSYLNRPEKTKEAFLKNPLGPGRIYRTGDMVVTHSDGSIEMIGRIDFQVKINGQRVEPGETNYYIQEHHDVCDSCTIAATVAGKKTLVAVVVSKDHRRWPQLSRELQQLLRQKLPSYMVPPYWLNVQELPLNINGKVDVPHLVQLVESTPRGELLLSSPSRKTDVEQLPLEPVEEIMRTVWSKVLKIPADSINPGDSFMDLGGSSLEAIMVVSTARTHLIDIKAQDIMIQESLRDLAQVSRRMAVPLKEASIQPYSLLHHATPLDRTLLVNAWPVTPAQEPLIADVVLGGSQYLYSKVIRLKKQSIMTFKAAFTALYKRNAFLRSTFVEHGNTYLQLIRAETDIPWTTYSKPLNEYLRSGGSQKLALGEPFCRIVQTESGELIVTLHHALFDYWSSQFLFDDIRAFMTQQQPQDRPLYDRYAKFISDQDEKQTRQYWKDYLRGAGPNILGAPHSEEPEMVITDSGIDLHILGKVLGIPAGSLLYTAWAVALSSESNTRDVTFGIAISGRDSSLPGILDMYGPTVTNVPLRLQLDHNMALKAVGKAVQAQVLSVSEHGYCGLRSILRASGHKASLFNTAANFLFRPTSDVDHDIEFLDHPSPLVRDVIKLEVNSQDTQRLSLTSALGNHSSRSVLEKTAKVLQSLQDQPDVPLKTVLSGLEAKSPVQYDSAMVDMSHFRLAHSLFEYRAVTHSSKVALVDEFGTELTYQQVNKKANQLAAFLQKKGARPESVIPMYLDKSIDTIVSMLGIWKAGAAFCPLDPANPPERNSLIVKEVEATVMIADSVNATGAAALGIETLIVGEVDLNEFDSENMVPQSLGAENLAYIIYTSGSTGKPKGVMVTHGNVAAASQGMIKGLSYTDHWRMLWALNYTFDGSYFDVFPLLGAGGTLCIVRQQFLFSDLAGYVNRLKVTHLGVTPTIASTFTPDDVPQLKFLNLGGEPLHSGILDIWAGRVQVQNTYGPTEGTVMVTTATVQPDSALNYIGLALPSAELSIRKVDSELEVPHGEIGELCISGPHVARGYLNRPDANRAAFFTDTNGQMTYRTGDLARLHPDGGYELSGRKDDQVKINGYRIELGEVENAIQRTGAIDGCIVLAPKLHQKKQLVACCKLGTPARETAEVSPFGLLDATNLHAFKDLPSKLVSLGHYMMPAIWVPFADFPQLTSGKVDRKSLLKIVEGMDSDLLTKFQEAMSTVNFDAEFTLAQSQQEQVLQEAWATVFEKDSSQISTSVAFHALGGDSITAINLVSTCRRRGYELIVADVMANPTIRMQATRLRPIVSSDSRARLADTKYGFEDDVYDELSAAGIERKAVEAIYPCLPGQAEFLTQGRTKHQFWQLMTVRKLPANFDLQRWTELLITLTARNQILRAIFLNVQSSEDPKWVQAILKNPIVDLDTILYDGEAEKQRIIDSLWESSFPLNKPAVQYRILMSKVDFSLDLYIKLDHGMYDGTLLRILDDQFIAMVKGLPPPPVTEFNQAIHHYTGSPIQKSLDFWSSFLRDTNFHWPPTPSSATKVDKFLVRKTNLETNEAARRVGVTAPIMFQTAWGLLLGAMAGTTDVVFDNLLTGRNLPLDDPQAINGNCANFLPFRSQFPPSTRLSTLLQETQTQFWETTNNGLIGLADIYKELNVARTDAAAKTMFCFQPFDPPPQVDQNDMSQHMRWIVMAMSCNRMYFNYAFMCEVFKAPDGYKVKFQFDSRALSQEKAEWAADKYLNVLTFLQQHRRDDIVEDLWHVFDS
ncbi:MAG: NRPS [Candelaria pacifica]|nr:MAG: NRPS [Candelaria pacifica]